MSNTRKEFEIVERKVAVWLINKDSLKRGKITARYTKKATIIAFIFQKPGLKPPTFSRFAFSKKF